MPSLISRHRFCLRAKRLEPAWPQMQTDTHEHAHIHVQTHTHNHNHTHTLSASLRPDKHANTHGPRNKATTTSLLAARQKKWLGTMKDICVAHFPPSQPIQTAASSSLRSFATIQRTSKCVAHDVVFSTQSLAVLPATRLATDELVP